MPLGDIRPIKAELRDYYKNLRRTMEPKVKKALDEKITDRVTKLWQYKECEVLLTYVSTAIEVDTMQLIAKALKDGKRVAAPRCIPGTCDMDFYYIDSTECLEPGSFGVLEPVPEKCKKLSDMSEGLCIAPALCYDWKGFRLGYGKGYYDRFLTRFQGTVVGICYSSCIRRKIPHGRFDRPVELLVTDQYLRRTVPETK